jgi:hypothetical protein
MKRRHLIYSAVTFGLLAAIAGGAVLAQQGTNVNPATGSIWTYLGPTFGAGWVLPIPPASQVGLASNYSVDLTGGSDATSAMQTCLNAGNGRCIINPGGKVRILGNLTIPAYTTLDCNAPMADVGDQPASPSAWTAMPSIRLAGTATIRAGGQAAALKNCLIYRDGMTFPVSDPATYPSGSTAFSSQGFEAPTLENDVIIGFDTCVNNYGSIRAFVHRVYVDCSGVANAAIYGGSDGDIGYYHDIKVQPLASTSLVADCTGIGRPGKGFWLNKTQAADIGEIITFVYHNGIVFTSGVPDTGFGGAQQHQIGRLWIDYPASCAGAATAGGLIIDGGASQSIISFANVTISGVGTGVQLVNAATPSDIHFDYLYIGGVNGDGIRITAGNYHLSIDEFVVNNSGSYALEYDDTTGTSQVTIGHASLYNIHGNVAPLINITSAAGTAAGYNPITVKSLFTNTPTLTLFQNSGAGVLPCKALVSAAALVVPSFPDCFALQGTTGITSMIGGVWPGREFVLYVPATPGPTITQGGNITLNGGVTFTPNVNALQSIAFRCAPNSPTTTGCREMWRSQ